MKIITQYTIPASIKLVKLGGEALRRSEAEFSLRPQPTEPTGLPDAHPSKRRADIVVVGRGAATVYESGGVNVVDKHRGAVLATNNDRLSADEIARKLASAFGGVVAKPRDWS